MLNPNLKTTYLVGAGFSKAVNAEMPLTRELAESLLSQRDATFSPYLSSLNADNFEAWLSSLSSPLPWLSTDEIRLKREAFDEACAFTSALIRKKSSACGFESCNSFGSSDLVDNLVRYCEHGSFDIISLNYDSLVEQHWRHLHSGEDPCCLYPFQMECGSVDPNLKRNVNPGFRLFKLHGSVDWALNDSSIEYCDDWLARDGKSSPKGIPYIIPPVSVKDHFYQQNEIRDMWRLAKECLEETQQLVVMGYSFPPSDRVMEWFVSDYRGSVQVLDNKPEKVYGRMIDVFQNCRGIEFLKDGREAALQGVEESDPIGHYCFDVLDACFSNRPA